MSEILEANDSNFDAEVLQSDVPVLVEFGATWCGPCKRQKPILEQFAQTYTHIKVVMVDIDESPQVAARNGIRSVPTLMLFNNGNKVGSIIGLSTLKSLENFILQSNI